MALAVALYMHNENPKLEVVLKILKMKEFLSPNLCSYNLREVTRKLLSNNEKRKCSPFGM